MRRVDIVFRAFEKIGGFRASRDEAFSQKSWRRHLEESARRRQQALPVLEAPRGGRDTGTRVSGKRALSRGVGAAREGAPQNVSFDTPFLIGERVQSVRMNFSIEKTGNDSSEDDAQFYSE